MKKAITFILFIVLLSSIVLAAMPPWPAYCEHQGYTYEDNQETLGFCVFDEENKCDAKEFLDGTCGQEYVKEIPCRQDGEVVFSFEECCEGLDPKSPGLAQATCQELGFFEKVWRWIVSIF